MFVFCCKPMSDDAFFPQARRYAIWLSISTLNKCSITQKVIAWLSLTFVVYAQ